jgi:hypothetical protein
MAHNNKTKIVTVSIPPDVHRKIKGVSRAEDRNFSNALVQLVRRATGQTEDQTQELATQR